MYKNSDNRIIYSPSDLIVHMRSPFGSWMDRWAVEEPEATAHIDKTRDPMLELLAKKGDVHEETYLSRLKELHGVDNVAVISAKGDIGINNTKKAMKAGYPVIFQANLRREDFVGYADFLIRKEGQSDLGNYYYEAWDTKLSRTTRPYFVLQLCCYSWMLED